MESHVEKLPSAQNNEKEKSCTSSDEISDNSKGKKINSWDRSTSSQNGVISKRKNNDWDSSSGCQVTLVEPFDNNVKELDNWDSESDKDVVKPNNVFLKETENILGSFDSVDLSEFSDIEKSSISELIDRINSHRAQNSSLDGCEGRSEELLYVEDLEEFLVDNGFLKSPAGKESKKHQAKDDDVIQKNMRSEEDEKPPRSIEAIEEVDRIEQVRSIHSEGTPADSTIWMIPNSERTQSAESDTRLVFNPDRENLALFDEFNLKKSKSYPGVECNRGKRKVDRSCRSDSGYINSKRNNFSKFMTSCEGLIPQKSLDTKVKDSKESISFCVNFDKSSAYFAEYECRAFTSSFDQPDKTFSDTSRSIINSNEEIISQANNSVAEENNENSNSSNSNNTDDTVRNNNGSRHSEATLTNLVRTGPTTTPLDVLSLPDMTGRNSMKERQGKEKIVRRVNPSNKSRNDDEVSSGQSSITTKNPGESWFLLDETGQYQPVTRNEVTILLNGRSADDVLQEKKEHVIPNASFMDSRSPNSSLSNILTKESLQYILREDDKGGEGPSKRLIALERKVENTLLYIQPSTNLTASIRLIPVDTEMIHIWRRRVKDSGSMLSSEIDLRVRSSQESFENAQQRNENASTPGITSLMEIEKSEIPLTQQVESVISASPTVMVRTGSLNDNFSQNTQTKEYSELLIETRAVVDTLTNHFKILQSRLDGEMNRSMALEGEVCKLRKVIKIIGKSTLDDQLLRELVSDPRLYESCSASLSTLRPVDNKSSSELINEDELILKNKSLGGSFNDSSSDNFGSQLRIGREDLGCDDYAMKSEEERNIEETEKEIEIQMKKFSDITIEENNEIQMENDLNSEDSETETKIDLKKGEVQVDTQKIYESEVDVEKEGDMVMEIEKEGNMMLEMVEMEKERDMAADMEKEIEKMVEFEKERQKVVEIMEKQIGHAVEIRFDQENEMTVVGEQGEREREEAKYKDYDIEDDESDLDPGFITVNVYTMEQSTTDFGLEGVQKTNSLLQTNLGIIEGKMRNLELENESIMKENMELKRKLKEISQELEKYLANTSEMENFFDEDKEMDALRDQVCNLKLELDNLKKEGRVREGELKTENALLRNELQQKSTSLEECSSAVAVMFKEVEMSKNKLQENYIIQDINLNFETIDEPKLYLKAFTSFVREITETLFKMYNENLVNQEVLKEVTRDNFLKKETSPNIIDGLDQVISGYTELIDQCRKSSGDGNNKVMEDYFTVIMEKASLMEEIKILKTENEMLMESQLEHYEKLKQTMIALKDKKNEITALESTQKLSEEERSKMISLLEACEEEKKYLKDEIEKKTKLIENLMSERNEKDLELSEKFEKFKEFAKEIKNFEKSCRLKDELINQLKIENEQLLNADKVKNDQVEIFREDIKNLKTEKKQIETELESMKLFVNDSQKEMTEYIAHLETVINNCQESLDKTKQKLKESNQALTRLKNDNDVLDQQHQCDVKLYNKTKEELDSLKDKVINMEEKFKEVDEEKEKLHARLEKVLNSEREKTEELDAVTKERKILLKENSTLKEKVEMFSRDKDESLKDQKDLINKYAILSKEVQKFQEKYRNVKTECNKRTDLIKYLETMLRENLMEYNNRILCLEKNISHIIEKIAACKNCMREKHAGVDAEVRELRHQLEVTYQERKELENVVSDYYSVLKRLENEIEEKEKKVDELHVKLSQEQQKAFRCEKNKSPSQSVQEVLDNTCDALKIKKLESKILITENELLECRKQLQECETNHVNEKKKLELTIADLKSEINRYQIRNEVMMKNLSSCNKTLNGLTNDKRNTESAIKNFQMVSKEIEEKNKKILELNETISSCKVEIKTKESDLENLKTKNICLKEEVKNLKDQLSKMQDTLSTLNKNFEMQQKEKNEMAEKLLQSIKLIMEERSARQTLEALTTEKEKNFKEQIDHLKNELSSKIKESEALCGALEDNKKYSNKLQDDLKKMKSELISLRKKNLLYLDSESHKCCVQFGEPPINSSTSLTQIKPQNITAERLESCLRELREVREINLELRKTEGQYQAKIVCLQDEIRDARLLIKELQGDLRTERKSKKTLKKMIASAKMEIERCLEAKQLISIVAERIKIHLDLSEVSSRELLSGFRSNESVKSPQVVD